MLLLVVDTLSHGLPGNVLAILIVNAALDRSTALALSPGRKRLDVECLAHHPFMFKQTAHDCLTVSEARR